MGSRQMLTVTRCMGRGDKSTIATDTPITDSYFAVLLYLYKKKKYMKRQWNRPESLFSRRLNQYEPERRPTLRSIGTRELGNSVGPNACDVRGRGALMAKPRAGNAVAVYMGREFCLYYIIMIILIITVAILTATNDDDRVSPRRVGNDIHTYNWLIIRERKAFGRPRRLRNSGG